jgi:hypothetical protein
MQYHGELEKKTVDIPDHRYRRSRHSASDFSQKLMIEKIRKRAQHNTADTIPKLTILDISVHKSTEKQYEYQET